MGKHSGREEYVGVRYEVLRYARAVQHIVEQSRWATDMIGPLETVSVEGACEWWWISRSDTHQSSYSFSSRVCFRSQGPLEAVNSPTHAHDFTVYCGSRGSPIRTGHPEIV